MPEFMGVKITRAEELARHAYRRALAKALRTSAKGTGWRCVQGVLLREHQGWFFAIVTSVSLYRRETNVQFLMKPMAVDPIFWEITSLTENNNTPLSFRLLGAFTVKPLLAVHDIVEDDSDPAQTSSHVLQVADRHFTNSNYCEPMRFVAQLRETQLDQAVTAIVTTLIWIDELEAAASECELAISQKRFDGFLLPGGSFRELALQWITKRLKERRIH